MRGVIGTRRTRVEFNIFHSGSSAEKALGKKHSDRPPPEPKKARRLADARLADSPAASAAHMPARARRRGEMWRWTTRRGSGLFVLGPDLHVHLRQAHRKFLETISSKSFAHYTIHKHPQERLPYVRRFAPRRRRPQAQAAPSLHDLLQLLDDRHDLRIVRILGHRRWAVGLHILEGLHDLGVALRLLHQRHCARV